MPLFQTSCRLSTDHTHPSSFFCDETCGLRTEPGSTVLERTRVQVFFRSHRDGGDELDPAENVTAAGGAL